MKRIFSALMVFCFIMFIGSVNAAEFTVTERFDNPSISLDDPQAPETIYSDTIFDTMTGDKSYSSKNISGGYGKLMIKNLKLHTNPAILDKGPLGERDGVLYTGKSEMIVSGVSEWYHFAGLMYDFGTPCTSLSMSFSYLNNRLTSNGKVVIVIQDVDRETNSVNWEETWNCTGYKSYINGWENLNLTNEQWFSDLIGGRTFNRVWIVEAELYLDRHEGEGGYFDDISITVIPEEVVEEPEMPEVSRSIEDNIIVEDAVYDIAAYCPCDNDWKNHGQFVKCVVDTKKELYGIYPDDILEDAIRIAAQADCGKPEKGNKNRERNRNKK